MARLLVKNIGPIKFAELDLKKVTVLIGPQSSGKSTLAKLISFCTWLEKNKLETDDHQVFISGAKKRLEQFHRMKGYFSEKSVILYQGDNITYAYNFDQSDAIPLNFSNYNVEHFNKDEFFFFNVNRTINPKVMYMPAERNFVSVVPNLKNYAEDNDCLQSYINTWFEIKRKHKQGNPLELLNLDVRFYSEDDADYIQLKNNKKILLSSASSGLQSITPLLVMGDWLTKGMYEEEEPYSQKERDTLEKTLRNLSAGNNLDKKERERMERRLLSFLQGKVYTHTHFILEEPEQNLFPTTQCKLLEYYASIINHGKQHKLVLTTHSPYIINYLNVLIRRRQDASGYINSSELSVYLIKDGQLQNLMMHDIDRGKWAVDTTPLSDVMSNIFEEYKSLL